MKPCHATCQDPDAPDNCNEPCVEGCECDVGYVLSGDNCVMEDDCGCTDNMGSYYELGERWGENGEVCECKPGNVIDCVACAFDVVFILDRSSSIGPYGMYMAQAFIANIIRCLFGLNIRVGHMVHECEGEWIFTLGAYTPVTPTSGLLDAVYYADYTGGESRTGFAIRFMKATANFRDGVPRAAVLLTDGRSYGENPNNHAIQAAAARAMGIELYGVTIGRDPFINRSELETITDDPTRVYDLQSGCALAYRLMALCLPDQGPSCPFGDDPLAGSYCGRGGTPCPAGWECNIHPADAWAVCCPIIR